MTPGMFYLSLFCITGLLAIAIYKFIKSKRWKQFVFQVIILIAVALGLYFIFLPKEQATERGSANNDIYVIIVLYLFMLLGMLANYLYNRFEQPKAKRKAFDFGLFIAPVFASPIIFIPLLAALQNADIDLNNLTLVKLMVFLVAFENGFFWKEYFDNRRQMKQESS